LEAAAGRVLWIHRFLHSDASLLGVATATIVLAIFLCCEGVVEIAFYFHIRRARHAVWVLFDGIVTLILGYLVWSHWPSNLAWMLGTLIGISLMFSGISRFMRARAFPRLPLILSPTADCQL